MHINETIWPGIAAATIGLVVLWAYARRVEQFYLRWPLWMRIVNGAAISTLAVAWVIGVHAWLIEPRTLVVRHVDVASEHWAGSPLVIGVIADTHVPGPHVDPARVRSIVTRMNGLNPDVVVLLGDYVGEGEQRIDRSPSVYGSMGDGIAAFAGLRAPYGVVAVLGNRDRSFDRDAIARALESANVFVAAGRGVEIERLNGNFSIVGLANEEDAEADVRNAMSGVSTADRIVISHSPEPFPVLPRGVALMLAGHTHCGQVSVPFLGRPITHLGENRDLACHRVDADGQTLYTTAGVGTSGLPMRFLNPPEIVLITLRGAEPAN